jgi:hypothetical protein
MKTHSREPYAPKASGRLDVPARHSHRLCCSLALVGGGIAVALMTTSTLGVALMVPGFLSVILISVFALVGGKPQAQQRAK